MNTSTMAADAQAGAKAKAMAREDKSHLERLKRAAAEYVAQHYIRPRMSIGLGTGSTVRYFVDQIGALHQQGELPGIRCLSTSAATTEQARAHGIPLEEYHELLGRAPLDVAVDGADTVNRKRQLIKGGGGALTREKIIAYNSREVVIIIDESKYTPHFTAGTCVPLEVLGVARHAVMRMLLELRPRRRPLFSAVELRRARRAVYKSDNGNVIVDAYLAYDLRDPRNIETRLNAIPGVVENGLFTAKAVQVVMASSDGIRSLAR